MAGKIKNDCPHCGGRSFLQPPDGVVTRKRSPNQKVLQCDPIDGCGLYVLRIKNGNVYPLLTGSDPDSDTGNRKK
jgi:hypothetical protein